MSRARSILVSLAIVVALLFASVVSADVIDLTPDNYDKIVNDPSKNVFVMFYAPWCGHCTTMKPAWADLGRKFPASEEVVIARVDASAHRDIAKSNDVRGFPTLKFFSKSNKKGVEYTGPREEAAWKLFIKTNTR